MSNEKLSMGARRKGNVQVSWYGDEGNSEKHEEGSEGMACHMSFFQV